MYTTPSYVEKTTPYYIEHTTPYYVENTTPYYVENTTPYYASTFRPPKKRQTGGVKGWLNSLFPWLNVFRKKSISKFQS